MSRIIGLASNVSRGDNESFATNQLWAIKPKLFIMRFAPRQRAVRANISLDAAAVV